MFGEGGRYDLKEKWTQGRSVGWDASVTNGKVIRLHGGGYITTSQMRPYLVDSDSLVALDPMEAHVPLPERRVRGKTTIGNNRIVTKRLRNLFGLDLRRLRGSSAIVHKLI